jgi:hypothetical protein
VGHGGLADAEDAGEGDAGGCGHEPWSPRGPIVCM